MLGEGNNFGLHYKGIANTIGMAGCTKEIYEGRYFRYFFLYSDEKSIARI